MIIPHKAEKALKQVLSTLIGWGTFACKIFPDQLQILCINHSIEVTIINSNSNPGVPSVLLC